MNKCLNKFVEHNQCTWIEYENQNDDSAAELKQNNIYDLKIIYESKPFHRPRFLINLKITKQKEFYRKYIKVFFYTFSNDSYEFIGNWIPTQTKSINDVTLKIIHEIDDISDHLYSIEFFGIYIRDKTISKRSIIKKEFQTNVLITKRLLDQKTNKKDTDSEDLTEKNNNSSSEKEQKIEHKEQIETFLDNKALFERDSFGQENEGLFSKKYFRNFLTDQNCKWFEYEKKKALKKYGISKLKIEDFSQHSSTPIIRVCFKLKRPKEFKRLSLKILVYLFKDTGSELLEAWNPKNGQNNNYLEEFDHKIDIKDCKLNSFQYFGVFISNKIMKKKNRLRNVELTNILITKRILDDIIQVNSTEEQIIQEVDNVKENNCKKEETEDIGNLEQLNSELDYLDLSTNEESNSLTMYGMEDLKKPDYNAFWGAGFSPPHEAEMNKFCNQFSWYLN